MNREVTRWARLALAAVLAVALAACGDSGGGGGGEAAPQPTAEITGTLRAESTGLPIAGARVLVASLPAATSGADGRFAVANVPLGDRVPVRIEAAGFATQLRVVALAAGANPALSLSLFATGATATVNPAAAVEVADASTGARLSAPPNAFRRSEGGASPTGNLTVSITSIDPTQDPARMPGDYTSSEGGTVRTIESFGAVAVNVRDSAGNRYTLAPGTSASLRIPAASRGGNLPPSVGLYSLDEATGRWRPEGSATLASDGSTRWYEATVTHLSWWNADIPVETILVRGCVRTPSGQPAANRLVTSVGQDYTGSASAITNAQGDFTVAMKRNGLAALLVSGGTTSPAPQPVGPSATDISLATCLAERAESAALLAPGIVRQPVGASVVAGDFAQFSVLADGSAPLRFQWQRNGVDVPGARSPVLSLFGRTEDDGARYRVVVSNAQGNVTSADAVLRVLPAPVTVPVITTEPAPQSVAPGTVARFSVVATGTAPLAYQWRRNGVAIAGATGSSYSLSGALADDGARFSVVVSNSAGSDTSVEALLTVRAAVVNTPPAIVAAPRSVAAAVGGVAQFFVEASGTPTLSYQWRRNGVNLPGETRLSLSVVVAAADNGARYSVEVRNAFGSVVSSEAVLTIATPGAVGGSLNITGTATGPVIGSFSPTADFGGDVSLTPPRCTGTSPTCTSSLNLTAIQTITTGSSSSVAKALIVAVTSTSNTPPGPQPGENPGLIILSFAASTSAGATQTFASSCGVLFVNVCASSGVSIDPVARTITFTNVRLFQNALLSSPVWIDLNGVLTY